MPKGLPSPENTIVETIVCEEFDDGWGGTAIQTSVCIDLGDVQGVVCAKHRHFELFCGFKRSSPPGFEFDMALDMMRE